MVCDDPNQLTATHHKGDRPFHKDSLHACLRHRSSCRSCSSMRETGQTWADMSRVVQISSLESHQET